MPAVITIGIDPYVHLGPVTLAWHGLTIAIGVLVGAWLAARVADEYGLPGDRMTTVAALAAAGGLIGGRLLYLAEHDDLLHPGQWLGTQGFSFNGGLALAAITIAAYVRRAGLPLRYLDAIAVGLPLGLAVGRIGDVINGEHYGPPTDSLLGVRNSHPDASVPSPDVAYHSGGLYDLLIGAVIFAVVWPLRHRLRRPTEIVWLVLALLGAGRFVEFFARSDSDRIALGVSSAQWTSLAILAVGACGLLAVRRVPPGADAHLRGRPSQRLAGDRDHTAAEPRPVGRRARGHVPRSGRRDARDQAAQAARAGRPRHATAARRHERARSRRGHGAALRLAQRRSEAGSPPKR